MRQLFFEMVNEHLEKVFCKQDMDNNCKQQQHFYLLFFLYHEASQRESGMTGWKWLSQKCDEAGWNAEVPWSIWHVTEQSELKIYIDRMLSDGRYVSVCIQVVIWTSIGWMLVCTDSHHLASLLPRASPQNSFQVSAEEGLWRYEKPP